MYKPVYVVVIWNTETGMPFGNRLPQKARNLTETTYSNLQAANDAAEEVRQLARKSGVYDLDAWAEVY